MLKNLFKKSFDEKLHKIVCEECYVWGWPDPHRICMINVRAIKQLISQKLPKEKKDSRPDHWGDNWHEGFNEALAKIKHDLGLEEGEVTR